MRYGISFLMGLVFVAAVACGIAKGSFLAFGIGFLAFGVILIQLVMRVGSPDGGHALEAVNDPTGRWGANATHGLSTAVVCEMGNAAEAHLLRNYLADRGLDAWVEGDQTVWIYPGLHRPRVLVRSDQLGAATQILTEFTMRSSNEAESVDEQGL
ncbi:MAG: hypothetical protein HY000_19275 [Planctomycetes bacterium]|nr:hypothetical protein [Planctomycetota bacterium]